MSRSYLPNRRAHEVFSQESWRPIPGYEGLYQVSDLGRVRSLDRTIHFVRRGKHISRFIKGRLLELPLNKDGYSVVTLCDGDQRVECVHTLVLTAFVGDPLEGQECLHGDGDRTNNRLLNLRWGTSQQNCDDMARHGTRCAGSKSHLSRLTEAQVTIIKASDASRKELALVYGVSLSTIHHIKQGRSWRHVA